MLIVLVVALLVTTIILTMKTAELAAAISGLSTAVTTLSGSVDRAVDVLGNQNVTPDSDVLAAASAIESLTGSVNTANSKLVAALPPVPTP